MAQTFKIKRSTANATPTTLLAGELAYSGKASSNKLFIGHPDGTTGVVTIGGQYYTNVIDSAASANTVSTLVIRDGSGDFSAGTITASLTGEASSATILATSRTIGGVSFNGSVDINLPGVNTSGNQDTSGNAATATLAAGATILATTRNIGGVAFNGATSINLPGVNTSGNQDTSGNAATATLANEATILADARTISGTSFDGSVNITLNTSGITENTNLYYTNARADARVDAGFSAKSTSNLSEGTNLYFTNARVDTRVDTILSHAGHGNITVADGADGKLVLTAAAQYADSDARAAISVTDSGGDGSASYNSTTGVITYTGPSASEVRAHVSGGTGVGISSGEISIGQAVATTSNVTFNNVDIDGVLTSNDITSTNISIDGNATITGNLTVEGTTTTVNSTTVAIGDNILVLNKDEAGTPSANAGIEVERGTSTNVSLVWNESLDYWTVSDGSSTSKILTAGNFAASFTGTLDGGTF